MSNRFAAAAALTISLCTLGSAPAIAAPDGVSGSGLSLGLVLDGGYTSRALALEQERGKGFGLGHTELGASANVDDWFRAQVTAALHSHDGETELELEEAYLDALRLPGGLGLRAGRFLSQIGYLNGQHTHADDFALRPLMYRGLLGSHYFDDGLQLNWVLPTAVYARVGVELFSGRAYIPESTNNPSLGAWTLSAKVGGDVGRSHSWQAGLATMRNRREAAIEEESELPGLVLGGGDAAANDEHEHDHAHGAGYTGAKMWIADFVWKWAPDGNSRNRQLRLSAEMARVTDINANASGGDHHQGWTLAAVYRFHPQWEIGVSHGDLKVSAPHGDHFHRGRISETSVMLAWKRSHFSTLRMQYTSQRDRGDFDQAGNALLFQYVMSLGAHGVHAF